MLSRWVGLAAAWLLWVALGPVSASAHDLPLDRFMNGFVRIEPRQADLVMRIPLDLLRAVSFPIVGGHYDLTASQTAIKPALDALSDDLGLWRTVGACGLPAPPGNWRHWRTGRSGI